MSPPRSQMLCIVTPTPFSPTAEWEGFLERTKRDWPQDDPAIQSVIKEAESELLARKLSGKDEPLSMQDSKKYWALVYPSAPMRFSPVLDWRRALASLRDPKVYPQDNPVVRQRIQQAETFLASRQKDAA